MKEKYRSMFEQCFIPIFVKDGFDTEILLEGCKLAGVKWIEYTLRREDAHKVIPTLKKRYPEFNFTVGSTLDSEKIVKKLSSKYEQLMTFSEIAKSGADGYVSMLPMSCETLREYSDNFIMVPGAETMWEALREVDAGAHFIKIMGGKKDLVKSLNMAPAFKFCPIFVTGGVTPEAMPEVYGMGVVLTAAGFDLILKGIDPATLTKEMVAEKLLHFINTAKAARQAAFPELCGIEKLSDDEFFGVLPNYSRF